VAAVDWADPDLALDYERLPPGEDAWLLATGEDRALIDRLAATCLRLDDPSLTTHIFQGLITSADSIYHVRKLAGGRYECTPRDGDPPRGRPHTPPYEVEVEDAIMRPLVSGSEAKRYEEPVTDTYLLFPYERDARGRMGLIPAETMADRYPQAWAYLLTHEPALRARENGAFNDETWFRFGQNQNIHKQDEVKLIVAQTVPAMRVCADTTADKYLNNVRVNGILSDDDGKLDYVLGVLNGSVGDFVFKRLGKPKQGGWYEANKTIHRTLAHTRRHARASPSSPSSRPPPPPGCDSPASGASGRTRRTPRPSPLATPRCRPFSTDTVGCTSPSAMAP